MILILDTTTLVELSQVDYFRSTVQLTSVEVLDVVLSECSHPSYPDLAKMVDRVGVQVVQTEFAWFNAAQKYRNNALSIPDILNLYYAKAFGRILVTDEKPLRTKCQQESVETREISWLIKVYWLQGRG